jgi:hypothetical protein
MSEESSDPVEFLRRSIGDAEALGKIWQHYRERLRRVVRLRMDRRLQWLEQAVAAGYKNISGLAGDHDLDALRERDDFKKLLARLRDARPN